MPRQDPVTAEALLHDLLDRFESPLQRSRDVIASIDYTKVGGPAAQDEFHRVLADAARAGGVKLEAGRLERFTGEFARVRLIDASKLCTFLGRVPASVRADAAQQRIEQTASDILREPFFAGLRDEAVASWRANKTYLGLPASDPDTLVAILRLAHGILHLDGRDIDHRTFSRRIARDSKALERHEGRVAQLLKRANPALAGEEPREILEASGIVRRAHLLQVKGPIRLISEGLELTGAGSSFVGLTWSAVQAASLMTPVDYIITIENPTSFWRYCSEVEGNYLALLSDGFPARDVLAGMTHLVRAANTLSPAQVYHWGDVDAGGLRIAAHLEDAFELPLRLHLMSPSLAMMHGSPLRSRQGLERLSMRPGEIGVLAQWLLTNQATALEQEELDPLPPA